MEKKQTDTERLTKLVEKRFEGKDKNSCLGEIVAFAYEAAKRTEELKHEMFKAHARNQLNLAGGRAYFAVYLLEQGTSPDRIANVLKGLEDENVIEHLKKIKGC